MVFVSPFHRWPRILLLNIAAILTALSICEILLRINNQVKIEVSSTSFVNDSDLGYVSPKVIEITHANSLNKIVFSGSSITQNLFRNSSMADEITLLATPGYNLEKNVKFLEKFAASMKGVTLVQEINLATNFDRELIFSEDQTGKIRILNFESNDWLNLFSFLSSFQTYQQVLKKFAKYFFAMPPEKATADLEAYLERLVQFSKAHEIKLYLVIYPIFSDDEIEQNERKLNVINAILASKKVDLKVIDLYANLTRLSDYQSSKWDNTHTPIAKVLRKS